MRKPNYLVSVDYQTTAGNPATAKLKIQGTNGPDAISKATAKVKAWKRCMKVVGGDYESLLDSPAIEESGKNQPTVVDGYQGPYLSGLEAEFYNFCKKDKQMVEEFTTHLLQNGKQFLGFVEKEVDWNAEAERIATKWEEALSQLAEWMDGQQSISLPEYFDGWEEIHMVGGELKLYRWTSQAVYFPANRLSKDKAIVLASLVQKAIAERNPQP